MISGASAGALRGRGGVALSLRESVTTGVADCGVWAEAALWKAASPTRQTTAVAALDWDRPVMYTPAPTQ